MNGGSDLSGIEMALAWGVIFGMLGGFGLASLLWWWLA